MTDDTNTASTHAIAFEDVTRHFGDVTAVDGLNLRVRRGELYGFLGPNGAGKSTTIGMLLGFLQPSNGRITAFGRDVRTDELAVKARTGALPEGFTPYSKLTGREHVRFVCSVRDDDTPPEQYLDRVGLSEAADQKAGGYSTGMTRRLGLAMALVGDPDLLVLDEPIAGLDPNGATRLREIVSDANDRGTTVFFSSHQLAQVEAICDRVGILNDGELVTQASVDDLRETVGGGPTLTITPSSETIPTSAPTAVTSLEGVEAVRVENQQVVVDCADASVRADVMTALVQAGIEVDDFETDRPSLEDLFAASVDA